MKALVSYNKNSYVFSFARWAVSQIIRASTDTILCIKSCSFLPALLKVKVTKMGLNSGGNIMYS